MVIDRVTVNGHNVCVVTATHGAWCFPKCYAFKLGGYVVQHMLLLLHSTRTTKMLRRHMCLMLAFSGRLEKLNFSVECGVFEHANCS